MSASPARNRDAPVVCVYVLYNVHDEKEYALFSTLKTASIAYYNYPTEEDEEGEDSESRGYLGIEKRPLDTSDVFEPEYETCEPLSREECGL